MRVAARRRLLPAALPRLPETIPAFSSHASPALLPCGGAFFYESQLMPDHAVMGRRQAAPDGKLDRHLDVMISEDLEESLIVLARLHGYQNRSEYVRDLLHRHVYGELERVQRLAARVGVVNRNNVGDSSE